MRSAYYTTGRSAVYASCASPSYALPGRSRAASVTFSQGVRAAPNPLISLRLLRAKPGKLVRTTMSLLSKS